MLANIILPIFLVPYALLIFCPPVLAVVIALEGAVIRLMHRALTWRQAFKAAAIANIISTILGFAICLFMPEGSLYEKHGAFSTPDADYGFWHHYAFVLAWGLSVLIEYLSLRLFSFRDMGAKNFLTSLLMNTASYGIILVSEVIEALMR